MAEFHDVAAALAAHPLYRGPIGGGEDEAAGGGGAGGSIPAGQAPAPGVDAGAAGAPGPVEPTGTGRVWGRGTNPLLADPTGASPATEQQAGVQPAPAAAQAAQTPDPGVQPGAAPPQIAPPQAEPAQQAEPEVLDIGGRKVEIPPGTDPSIAAALRNLHADYQHLQSAYTRSQQQLSAMRQQSGVQQDQQTRQQPPEFSTHAAQQAASQPKSINDLINQALSDVDSEKLMNDLYENPATALQEVLSKALAPVVDHLQQQAQDSVKQYAGWVEQQQLRESFESELGAMTARPDLYPDLAQMKPVMEQVLQSMPHLLDGPNPMATAYRIAKGYVVDRMPIPAQMTVDSILSNQQLVQQLLQDERFRQPVIQSYVAALRQGQPPATITATGGGTTPVVPPSKPRNIKEATQAWMAQLGMS